MQKKKKRNYKGQLFRAKRPYELKEIAQTLGIHIRTVQGWLDKGLKRLDSRKPYMAMGFEIRRFLKQIIQKRKRPLKPGEFYCPRCKTPRKSQPEQVIQVRTHRKLGKNHESIYLKGICEVCGLGLMLFSSERIAAEWFSFGFLKQPNPLEPAPSTPKPDPPGKPDLTKYPVPETFPKRAPKKRTRHASIDQTDMFKLSAFKPPKSKPRNSD